MTASRCGRCGLAMAAVALLVACGVSVGQPPKDESPLPQFRHTNYIAVLGEAGKAIELSIACHRHGPYEDSLVFRLIDSASEEVDVDEVEPGSGLDGWPVPTRSGLHVLVLSSGWNVAAIDLGDTPHAVVVKRDVPLQTVRRVERLHFYVPKGMQSFDLFISSSVTGEGLRFQVSDPDGTTVIDEDGDFDAERRFRLTVPRGMDGRAWSLAILEPRTPGLGLDDAMLRLDEKLPPYLAKKPDWAVLFGKRRHP